MTTRRSLVVTGISLLARDVQRALHPLIFGGGRALGGPGLRPQRKKKEKREGRKRRGRKKRKEKERRRIMNIKKIRKEKNICIENLYECKDLIG